MNRDIKDKKKLLKVRGKTTLNQKHQIFADKRIKRKKTRQTKNKDAIIEYDE